MNIKEAKDVYSKHGASLHPDYEALSTVFRQLDIEAPISNSNFLHALSLTHLMFHHADRRLEMVTGGCGDGFIQCLKQSFLSMLDKIRASGGTARIIVIDGDCSQLNTWAAGAYKDVLQIVRASAKPGVRIAHFIVCDDDMVRDEEPHGPLTDTTDANQVKAQVYFHNHSKARIFSSRFSAMWNALGGNSQT